MNKIIQARTWRIWLSLGATAIVGIALGCGQVGGAGQCNGVDVTGACETVDSVVPTDPLGAGGDTPDVDAYQTAVCPTSGTAEPFGEHKANVTISANLMPGVTSSAAPAFIEFTSYTIDYTPSPTNLIAAPPLTSQAFGPISFKVKTDGTQVTQTLEFVNTVTKKEYVDLGGSKNPAMTYSAKYTFKGTSEFAKDVALVGSATFNMGDYNYCK
ncbi:MAG: hypothetical protein HY283_01170 [Nitrospirae bacterium]|nr:hypothetical protein [Nitrospirota bacterium]